ncbi:peroxisomal biogenesis factor [Hysterangium stoloniferum]|nr:peroxisomal biogenesis factor [Hysterangium stoloniferum]
MASIASQIILHPVVSQSLKLWSTTIGRDKTYRAVQYFARFLSWYLLRRGYAVEGARWNNLKSSLASGRKLMRLFKPLENLQAALRAIQTSVTGTEQITSIARQLSYFGYLFYDMLVWTHSIRFITFTPDRAVKINKISLRFWLSGILFSLVNGIVKAGRLANEVKALRNPSGEKAILDDSARRSRLNTLATQRAATRHQLVIDMFDVWLPATALGLVNVNDGAAGILGFISSVMALRAQWEAVASK